MIMPIRLLTIFDSSDELLKDRAGRLMTHREERMEERSDWDWVDQKIVQPVLRISASKTWTADSIQDCVGFIRSASSRHSPDTRAGNEPLRSIHIYLLEDKASLA